MVHALGWSSDEFLPTEPGRLCRGRERWIESYPLDDPPTLNRAVISGAAFTDDSARDAQRGLSHSGLKAEDVLQALADERAVLAWCEEGHPLKVPDDVMGLEEYDLHRMGGPLRQWTVRWVLVCTGPEDIARAIDAGADCFTLHDEAHPAVDDQGVLLKPLRDAVFLLTGSRHQGYPERRFQPVALPELLDRVDAVVLVHRDKHDICLGVYTEAAFDPDPVLVDLVEGTEILPVPFAIPPMLARWDRALWELRQEWEEAERGEFPVPPAPEGSWGWGRRRRKRRRSGSGDEE